ncbi:MAG TPA: AMP-binding protein [Acidimicrobiales bacterium]|nr:AMP-binding protein [Acidimicrobiales bacterium]
MTAPAWARHLAPGARWEDLDLLEGGTIGAVAARWAARQPERPAFGPLAWGDLVGRSETVAGRLARLGVRRGDPVLCSAPPSVELVVAHLAALRMGAVVVPANTAYGPAELGHIVADARPAAAIIDAPARVPGLPAVTPAVEADDGPVPALDGALGADAALIGYTSGTTGRPKGAVLTHANLLAGARSVGVAWRWSPEDRLVLALPLFHAHGLAVGVHGTLVSGASAEVLARFEVDAVLDAVDAGATLLFGVPTMWGRLAASPRADVLRRLRLCISGSAPLSPAAFARVREVSGQEVVERYGMTETLMLTSNPVDGERRAGTVGVPLPGVNVRLADDGEVLVRGPAVFGGYLGQPPGAAFTADGMFRTGDVGEWDAAGYLRIVGRTKELIISGGFNVYPREVEDVLVAHPAVAEAAVVGLPSDEWGEEVVAAVVLASDVAPDALVAWCRDRLAHFKCPRRVRAVPALPRNAMGKIDRTAMVAGW